MNYIQHDLLYFEFRTTNIYSAYILSSMFSMFAEVTLDFRGQGGGKFII